MEVRTTSFSASDWNVKAINLHRTGSECTPCVFVCLVPSSKASLIAKCVSGINTALVYLDCSGVLFTLHECSQLLNQSRHIMGPQSWNPHSCLNGISATQLQNDPAVG